MNTSRRRPPSTTEDTLLRLLAYVDRADRISDRMPPGRVKAMSSFWLDYAKEAVAADGSVQLDAGALNLMPDDEWLPLAYLVRPLMFSRENTSVEKMLELLHIAAPQLADGLKEVRLSRAAWLKEDSFLLTGMDEALAGTDPYRIWLTDTLEARKDRSAGDAALANVYLNGELFHLDPEKWRQLHAAGAMLKNVYKKAAQVRVLTSCGVIYQTRHQIHLGWYNGWLPK